MKIDVKQLLSQLEGCTETHPFQHTTLPIDETTVAQVTGTVILTHLGDGSILGQLTGQAQLTQPCHRCLAPTILHVPLDFATEFNSKINSKDTEKYPITNGEIDLSVPLTEEIIANFPLQVLCQDNCLGLCPQCGANLNDNPCKCGKVNYEVRNKINL
ncbi:MAG: DUF177 domain-containing protein [Patescibacteria group bacterium]